MCEYALRNLVEIEPLLTQKQLTKTITLQFYLFFVDKSRAKRQKLKTHINMVIHLVDLREHERCETVTETMSSEKECEWIFKVP